jgi:hypothetical protein
LLDFQAVEFEFAKEKNVISNNKLQKHVTEYLRPGQSQAGERHTKQTKLTISYSVT